MSLIFIKRINILVQIFKEGATDPSAPASPRHCCREKTTTLILNFSLSINSMKSIFLLALVLVISCSASAKPHQKVISAPKTYKNVLTKDLSCDLCIAVVTEMGKINIEYLYTAFTVMIVVCESTGPSTEVVCQKIVDSLAVIIFGLENQEPPQGICAALNYCEATPKIAQLH